MNLDDAVPTLAGLSPTRPIAVPGPESVGVPSCLVRLVVDQPGRDARVMVVASGDRLLIGRSTSADLCLDDPSVSREHAVVHFNGLRPEVEDLGSTNGVQVNDRVIQKSHPLMTGDTVQIGGVRLAVVQIVSAGPAVDEAGATEDLSAEVGAVACDPATIASFRLAARLARTDLSLLICGETGTGKEVIAAAVHKRSLRAHGNFVAVNCATLTDSLAESTLFGHERGSFTGAVGRRIGAFEAASGGTLFLDEVGELSADNQARLLRALAEGSITRIGSTRPVAVDVRVLAATNRDLSAEIGWRRFRSDLFYRLDGATIELPPLRLRPLDLVPLVDKFIADLGGRAIVSRAAMSVLRSHTWPGNIRELRNATIHALAVCENGVVEPKDLPAGVRGKASPRAGQDAQPVRDLATDARRTTPRSPDGRGAAGAWSGEAVPSHIETQPLRDRVADIERHTIHSALERTGGNQSEAARILGITRRALIYRMELHRLKPSPRGSRSV